MDGAAARRRRAQGGREGDCRGVARVPCRALRQVVAAGRVRVRRRDSQDGRRQVPQDRAARAVREAVGAGVLSGFPRTALVTGGASGIGAAIVARLRAEGADVLVLDVVDGFDVSDLDAWSSVEPVELACLNAGVTSADESVADYRRVVGVNVDGVVFGVRRLAEVMEPGSAIVVK